MKSDQIQPLNYCAHAIEDLREFEAVIRDGAPASARALRSVISLLQSSVKFILPNCCDLIDPEDLRQAHLDMIRLPFPCVAFEAPWEREDGPDEVGEFRQTKATKRIALCWESSPEFEAVPGLNNILDVFPDGGVFVLPIYWTPEYKRWTVALGGTFVPFENQVQKLTLENVLPATRIAHAAKIEAGQAKANANQIRAEPFCLLPEFFDQTVATYGSEEKAVAQIILDTHDETMVLVQACSVINCANVGTVDVPPSVASNKKRIANDKQPFFSYKVLQLAEDRRLPGGSKGGEHAPPRMHLRRGHLRRLESRVVWVRPTTVNAGSKLGTVLKDYALPPRE